MARRQKKAELDESLKLKQWLRESKEASAEWREKAWESYDFMANRQWSEEDSALLEEEGRPCVTFNRVKAPIDAVVGAERMNRQETRFLARTLADQGATDLYNAVVKWIRDESGAEEEEIDSFRDACICGMGWLDVVMEYDKEPDGECRIYRRSPLSMFRDPRARRRNLEDARYVIERMRLSSEEVQQRWDADAIDLVAASSEEDDERSIAHENLPDKYQGQTTNKVPAYVRVYRAQWFDLECYYRVVDPTTGQITALSEKEYKRLASVIAEAGVDYVKQHRRAYRQAYFLEDGTILEAGPCPRTDGFTYSAITGTRDERSGEWYGILEVMKDPQRWSNKFFSQFQDIVASNAKGGLLAETTAFVNKDQAEEDWNRAGAVIHLREGGLNKVKERSAGTFPTGVDQLLRLAMTATRETSGVPPEFVGTVGREQSYVVEMERKKSTVAVLGDLTGALRRARINMGRTLLHFVQRYIPDGQIIRVGESGQERYVQFIKNPDVVRYDVIVDTSASSPNMKMEVFEVLKNFLPALIKAGVPVPLSIIDFAPIPESVAEKLKQDLQQQMGARQPDPLEQAQKQAEVQSEQALAAERHSRAMQNQVEAQMRSTGA